MTVDVIDSRCNNAYTREDGISQERSKDNDKENNSQSELLFPEVYE